MIFSGKFTVALCLLCFYIEISDCKAWENQRRRLSRKSSLDRNSTTTRVATTACGQKASALRLESTILSIEEKLEKFEDHFAKILARLDSLDGQIAGVDFKLFNEQISDVASPSINARLTSWETKISELDNKICQLISDNRFDDGDSSELPLQVKLSDAVERLTDFDIVNQLKDSFENLGDKIELNLLRNNEKLDSLKSAFDEQHVNKNVSRGDEILMQILRKERLVDQTSMINELLSVVKARLLSDREDDTGRNLEAIGSSTDMVSSFEKMSVKKSQTTSSPRGLIFPNVRNKPAKINTTFVSESFGNKDIRGFSCVELMNAGMRQSGVYYLQIRGSTYWFLKVFCEQEIADGGWTVIQRREDFNDSRENFNRDWADYKNGFGDPAKEFWLGNENIFLLTNNEDYALRIELEDFEGDKRYAQYSHFKLHSEADYYKLEIDGYEGNAGDSLNDPTYGSNNSPFSTYNRDNDRSSLNCASMLKGGWWWRSCGRGLNGLYLRDPADIAAKQGIIWFKWKGWDYTLKRSTMMVKPLIKPLTS